jgi:putative Holliday junction resolvase
LAVSDPLGITAQGLPTLQRKNRREDLEALRRVVEQQGVSLIVVGNPLHMSGHEGAQSESAAAFAAQLRRSLDRQVVLWDERLTTAEAQRVLRESGVGISKRAAAVDRMAAVILLQSYLDRSRFDD